MALAVEPPSEADVVLVVALRDFEEMTLDAGDEGVGGGVEVGAVVGV
jgi:hypothetical protein